MTVDVSIAPLESKDVVGRLLEFNEYEFSRIDQRPIGLDGRYGYRYLDHYWDPAERRFPYLLHVEGELAGLALVATTEPPPSGVGPSPCPTTSGSRPTATSLKPS